MKSVDELERIGATQFRLALSPEQIERIASLFADDRRPGERLNAARIASIADLLSRDGAIGAIAAALIGVRARPVRALLLDKSPEVNWRLGWHQDRTIAVRRQVEVDGFDAWSVKSGQLHVQPPHEINARMVTLRAHVDRVDADNAPLLIIGGSHLLGRLNNEQVDALAHEARAISCLADPGDIWAYCTTMVHASAKQGRRARRRVLQVDYSADELPGGLQWQPLL